jgi:hypothetical protein
MNESAFSIFEVWLAAGRWLILGENLLNPSPL